ncbi:MAG: phosphotransferase [Actinomycetota bacterium]|nr:phosphotransferase [Actinomycetota bacterium]
MPEPPKAEPIAALVASPEGRILAESVLGTADPGRIASSLKGFCSSMLGSPVEDVLFCEVSIGAAFGLRLSDARRVVLKAHPPDQAPDFLASVHRVQLHLSDRGFPCPRPVLGPTFFGAGLATVDELVDAGEFADAHEPEIRSEMARALARLIELASEVPQEALAPLEGPWWPKDGLWPPPHNALFDFEATAAGAGWIDEIAMEAKWIVQNTPIGTVVCHGDWSANQMRFEGGKMSVAYDWDSLRVDKETTFVGHAATHFPYTDHLDVLASPSPEEVKLFVEEYEAARGASFSGPERAALFAAATYSLAYTARCEHAVDPKGNRFPGSRREALASTAEGYLRS